MSTPEQIAFKKLVEKYLAGTASAKEVETVEAYYQLFAEAPNALDQLSTSDQASLELKLKSGISQRIKSFEKPAVPLYKKTIGVAAAVAAITLGIWLYYTSSINGRHPEFISGSPLANDVSPGKNTATLTLANGKTITLSDSKTGVVIGNDLRYNDGTEVALLSPSGRDGVAREGSNNSRVQTLTASTPRGGTYQVTLPDGSKVWLNADSRISFPTQFSGKQRKILLSGEAYFEVAKVMRLSPSGRDGRRPERVPFIVESNGQQVEVLGTHFNITAYKDETSTKTTLLEGSVRVAFGSPSASRSSLPRGEMASAREGNAREGSKNNSNPLSPQGGSLPEGERSIVLKPNEQSTLAKAGKITVKQVDPNEAIAWKEGEFVFRSERIADIMQNVKRWYDVEIIFENNSIAEKTFTADISRYDHISKLLNILQKTGKVKFRIDGRTIYVSE